MAEGSLARRVTDPRTLLLAYLGTKTVGLACPENTLSRGGDGKTQWVRNPCRAACEYPPFRSTLGVRHSCSPDPRRTQHPESNGWRWVFLPEAVIIETTEGRLQPVLCYISPTRNNHPADLEYLGNLIAVATEYGFPIGSSNASQASETNDNQTTGDAMPPIRIGHKRSRITDWALRLGPECGGLKDAMGRVITRHYGAVMIRTSSIS